MPTSVGMVMKKERNSMIGKANKLITYLVGQLEINKDKEFEIKEYKPKRSRNANNYAWLLLTKIADVLRLDKEEVYLDMLKHYGQSEMVSVLSEIDVKGYFKYYEKVGETVLNGKEFSHYKIFKGSSEYNSKEMAIFVDGVVQEAKQLDIDTITPAELDKLKQMWKE